MTEGAVNSISTCPKCGVPTVRAHLTVHPTAGSLREVGVWTTGLGFALFMMIGFLGIDIGEYYFGFGWSMATFSLMPASVLFSISLIYPKVWILTCAPCRKFYYRRSSGSRWRTA